MMLSSPSQMHSRTFLGNTCNLQGDWADDFINNRMVNAKISVAASCCKNPVESEIDQLLKHLEHKERSNESRE